MGCGSSNTSTVPLTISRSDMEDYKANTKFTEEEINNWHESFMYEHPNGQMDKNGFIKLYSGLYPNGNVEDFSAHLFRAYDSDGSGQIDFKEFLMTMNLASKGNADEKLRWAFSLYDVDRSGHITRTEATAIVLAIYRMQGIDDGGNEFFMSPQETVEEVWKALEKDSDGKLSEDEFVVGSRSNAKMSKLLQCL